MKNWAMTKSWLSGLAAAVTLASAGVFAGALANPAHANDVAEAFVASRANEALSVLNDDLPLAEKKERFRSLVEDVADVPRITRFVLGRYARGVSDADMDAFSDVFRQYAVGVYEARLGDYAGETLEVTGSTDRRPGDVIVHTEIAGGSQDDALPVNWRVLTDDGGQQKVVDVEVYGVWLAINQREEIVGIIQNNGGRVSAATQALRGKLEELESEISG